MDEFLRKTVYRCGYDQGFKDGVTATAEHIRLCKEEEQHTAEETQRRGIEYCTKHKTCDDCPLRKKVCITCGGRLDISYLEGRTDFVEFVKEFNNMIAEIYKGE